MVRLQINKVSVGGDKQFVPQPKNGIKRNVTMSCTDFQLQLFENLSKAVQHVACFGWSHTFTLLSGNAMLESTGV